MYILLFVIFAYLYGSVLFGIIASQFFGLRDPRASGSNNPGAMNVLRSGNKLAAALTLLGDGFKGWLTVCLAQKYGAQLALGDGVVALTAVAVFLGHLWPIFFQFAGGKGVATLFGILIALNPLLGLATVSAWLIVAYVFRYSSLASLVASLLAPFFYLFIKGPDIISLVIVLMSVLLVYRHAKNIENLLIGKEKQIGIKESTGNVA